MNLSPRTARIRCFRAGFAVLLLLMVGVGLLKSSFSIDSATHWEETALDVDADGNADTFLFSAYPLDSLRIHPYPSGVGISARVRTLSQPPATPPPITV